jgi:2-amino-4-hydroxy-6-hydroxymethyldihydropteridine diphosphokinase
MADPEKQDGATTGQGERVAIALGSNLGDSQAILTAALQAISETPGITLRTVSHYYRTVAVGPPQPDYINACALLTTHLTPSDLLKTLLDIEKRFGRIRQARWTPRLLDLDLLLFNDQNLKQADLEIPHPRMTARAFVLVPLAEVAPGWIDPISGRAIADLVKAVDCSGVTRIEG